ncbi:unnamed protein product [Cuscuta campestris]|uniref:Uncharacterized protein n=1 Tax=Cuscuta campestris TaxID=132261 RepID=A0A484KI44_9ASTE|nr:unnamed protein product [Cuscuta campestris]
MEKELSGHLNDEGTHGDVGGYSPGRNLREYEINELRMQALENQEAEAEALRAQLEKRQAELQEKARNEFSAPPQNQEAEAEAEAETLRAQLEKRQAELQEKAKFEKRAARGKKLRDQALRMEKELMVRPKHVRDLQTPQNQEAEALRAQLEKRRAELQEKARNEFRDAPENQEADAEALRSQQAKRQAELQDKARNVFKDAPQNQEADAEERQAEIQEKAGNEFWAAPQNQEAEALRAQAEQQEKARNEFRAARGEKSSDQALQRVWELDGRMNDEHRHENLGGHSLDKVSRENELRDEIIIKKNVITEKEGELMKTREQLFSGELMLPLICSLMLLIALLTEWPTEDAPWTFDTVVEKVQAYMTVVFKCRVDAFGRLNQDFDRYVNSYVQFLQRASDCDFNYRRTGLTHFSLNGIPNNHVNLGRLDEELRAAREELKNLELELWTLRAVAAE